MNPKKVRLTKNLNKQRNKTQNKNILFILLYTLLLIIFHAKSISHHHFLFTPHTIRHKKISDSQRSRVKTFTPLFE